MVPGNDSYMQPHSQFFPHFPLLGPVLSERNNSRAEAGKGSAREKTHMNYPFCLGMPSVLHAACVKNSGPEEARKARWPHRTGSRLYLAFTSPNSIMRCDAQFC